MLSPGGRRKIARRTFGTGEIGRRCSPDLQLRLGQKIVRRVPRAAFEAGQRIAAAGFGATARLIAAAALLALHLRRRDIEPGPPLLHRQLFGLFRHDDLLFFFIG
jgi:hypothetical protein